MQDTTADYITEPTFDPKRRYRCRHVFTEGHRCGSPALRGQDLCYYHHASRRDPPLAGRNGYFLMPRIDDRPAIQIAIYDILSRLSQFDIDPKRAAMFLYGLQIASSNLAKHERSAATTEPVVEDVVADPFLGNLAPIAEIPDIPTSVVSTEDDASVATAGDPAPNQPKQPALSLPKEPALHSPKASTASRSPSGLPPTHVNTPNNTTSPVTPVILSGAKNPRFQPGAPQTSEYVRETSSGLKTPEPAKLILAAVHATAASITALALPSNFVPRNLEPAPNLEPTSVPLPAPPRSTPYNRPNDFAYSGLPASNVSLPG